MEKLLAGLILIAIILITVNFFEKKSFSSRHKLPYQETYKFMGKTMSYKVLGKGQSVILLHDSMHTPPWNDFDEKLAKDFQVYVLDLPGFGASDAINGKIHNTDLFSKALCEFIKLKNLNGAPIISLSLGTVVSAKAAIKGCTTGVLIFVGAPSKVTGAKARILQMIPLSLKRMLIATYWAKDKLLIPTLYENIGNKLKPDNSKFIQDLETTDVRSIVDINYLKEINQEFPQVVKQLKNKIVYIYGENDAQKNQVNYLTKDFIEIKNSRHNIFVDQPEKLIETIKSLALVV